MIEGKMGLSEKTCVPCQGGVPALAEAEAGAYLKQSPGWELVDEARKIKRRFEFKNWADAFSFTGEISEIAEEQNHHPDISFGWGYVEVTIQTHKIGGLHENDFILASKINDIAY